MSELSDLFSEYAETMYGEVLEKTAKGDDDDAGDDDGVDSIENNIKAEIAGIKKPVTAQLFTPVRLDVQCGEFLSAVAADGRVLIFETQLSSSRRLLQSSLLRLCRGYAKMRWRIDRGSALDLRGS